MTCKRGRPYCAVRYNIILGGLCLAETSGNGKIASEIQTRTRCIYLFIFHRIFCVLNPLPFIGVLFELNKIIIKFGLNFVFGFHWLPLAIITVTVKTCTCSHVDMYMYR